MIAHRFFLLVIAVAAIAILPRASAEPIFISQLDLSGIEQDWGEPHRDQSVEGRPLKIAGRVFERGIGTHANATLPLALDGNAVQLSASVGVDNETGQRGSVIFRIEADGREAWTSGIVRGGEEARQVTLDLTGVKSLVLRVADAGDGIDFDHADWADLQIEMKAGKPRIAIPPPEPAVILTPAVSAKPRINSAKVFGVRPGSPFLFTIAATGERPMSFSANGLPSGLRFDGKTGWITGSLKKQGEYAVTLRAKNRLGMAERPLKIICGPRIGLTPALGWNSWNCFAGAVTAENIKAAADAMVASGLIDHGWSYINIDDFWQVHRNSQDPTLQGPHRDAAGRIAPNPRFPDMKGLADYVHSKGLRIGLYSSPGPWTCGGCVGSYDHELQDAQTYAEWGFDYLKYDWCSYSPQLESQRSSSSNAFAGLRNWGGSSPTNRAELMRPYALMREALARQPRDIIYSLCQYGMGNVWEWGAEVGGQSWRTTGDIVDTWTSMSRIGFSQAGHEQYAGPGHFNDPDMLVVGKVGWGPKLHNTRLTPNEQYTHISLWCLLASPLLIGCDMTQLDEFTLSLLTNDEVLEVNQDPLGRQAGRLAKEGPLEVWAKDMEDGSKAVGLFNRGPGEAVVTARWSDLGISGAHTVRDLWRQQDVGQFTGEFKSPVPRHGVVLVRIGRAK